VTRAWFVLERLIPMPLDATLSAAAALMKMLRLMNSTARTEALLITRVGTTEIRED
jgi:hypothetical protein